MEDSRTDDLGRDCPSAGPHAAVEQSRPREARLRAAGFGREVWTARTACRLGRQQARPSLQCLGSGSQDRPERLAGARAYQLHRVSIRRRDDCGGLLMLGRKREEPVEMLANQLDRHPERQVAQSE